ncbi:MAG: hypothetical protein AAFU67_06455 [Bacteroidota bacterium]
MARGKRKSQVVAKTTTENVQTNMDVGTENVTNVIELTGAIVKGLYEAEPNTNAYTDAEVAKLGGIENNATADQTDAEIATAYGNQVPAGLVSDITAGTITSVLRWSPDVLKTAIESLGGGGGGVSRSVDTPMAILAASIKAVRFGGSAITFGGSANAGYDVTIPADTEVTQLDFTGDSTTANASGELVLNIDNSANSYDRRFSIEVYDGSNNARLDQFATGVIPAQTISGNITTITIPNISGNFPSGVIVQLR